MGKKDNTAKTLGKVTVSLSMKTTVVFVGLRAADVIDWPWYWVLFPMILVTVWVVTALLVMGIAGVVMVDKEK